MTGQVFRQTYTFFLHKVVQIGFSGQLRNDFTGLDNFNSIFTLTSKLESRSCSANMSHSLFFGCALLLVAVFSSVSETLLTSFPSSSSSPSFSSGSSGRVFERVEETGGVIESSKLYVSMLLSFRSFGGYGDPDTGVISSVLVGPDLTLVC